MPWWGVLIVGGLCFSGGALAVWLVYQRPFASLRTARELADMKRRTAERVAAAERMGRDALERERRELAKKLQAVGDWYREAKWKVGQDAQKSFEALAGDPAALDRELARILGPDSEKGPT